MDIDESAISSEHDVEKFELLNFKDKTCEDLFNGFRAFYLAKGNILSICSSMLEKYVVLQCDKGGQYCDTGDVPLDEKSNF